MKRSNSNLKLFARTKTFFITHLSLFVIVLFSVVLPACKKQDAAVAPKDDKGMYMDFTFKGREYSFPVCYAVYNNLKKTYGISGSASQSANNGSVGISFNGNTKAAYRFGDLNYAGYSHLELTVNGDFKTYYSQYLDCFVPGPILYEAGQVSCTGTGNVNEYVGGSFEGTLIHINADCTLDKQLVKGTFKAKRVE